jgi:hypothetical protein|tara:strand:+ start:453 stop:887 length:435 start_codon:yes stop_codon:yes gene_type:complete
MKDTWQLPLKSRLKRWRELRKEIVEISNIEKQLRVVIDFWKTTPLGTGAIDPYNESTWPNPWDLLNTNNYDENVVGLCIAYTLHYSDIPCRILLVQNVENNEIKLIVLVDDLHILNYNYDTVDTKEVMQEFNVLNNIDVSALVK